MPDPSGPELGDQPAYVGWPNVSKPSVSVNETLHDGEVSVSSPANTRPVWRSVKPMGSESTNCEVVAGLLYQVAVWPFAGQLSSNLMKSVWRSDWKLVTPLAEFGEFQLTPIDGSPASCAVYSTVCTVGPWLLSVTWTNVPGASKFWNPILGPRSSGAAGASAVPA